LREPNQDYVASLYIGKSSKQTTELAGREDAWQALYRLSGARDIYHDHIIEGLKSIHMQMEK